MNNQSSDKKTPLENFFNLPVSTDQKEKSTPVDDSIITTPLYDEKDDNLDEMYADIQSRAINAHELLMDEIDEIEGRHKARFMEVANAVLHTGLDAIDRRARLKEHKDKLNSKAHKSPSTQITNQSITINTSKLIKELADVSHPIIDGEILPINSENK